MPTDALNHCLKTDQMLMCNIISKIAIFAGMKFLLCLTRIFQWGLTGVNLNGTLIGENTIQNKTLEK